MNAIVLDCSVAMAWCFEDESDSYADNVLETISESEAIVPAIWPLEISNVLLVGERRQRIKRADSHRFLELISKLPISVDVENIIGLSGNILSLGRENNLSSYDASYLELSIRKGIPLATMDRSLKKACKKCGVSTKIKGK